jgi:hypothetical protein
MGPHGFVVTFNDITKDASFYTSTSRFVAWLGTVPPPGPRGHGCPRMIFEDSSWSSPPLVLLREIHANLLAYYDCKDRLGHEHFRSKGGRWCDLASPQG